MSPGFGAYKHYNGVNKKDGYRQRKVRQFLQSGITNSLAALERGKCLNIFKDTLKCLRCPNYIQLP